VHILSLFNMCAYLSVWKESLSVFELETVMQYYKALYSIHSGSFWMDKWGKLPPAMARSHIRDSGMPSPASPFEDSGPPRLEDWDSMYCAVADELPCVASSGRLCTASSLSANGRQALGVDSKLLSAYRVASSAGPVCNATVACSGCGGCETSKTAIGYGNFSDGSGPSKYDQDVKCIFNISLDDGLKCGDIVVHFHSFQTEAEYDVVRINMGPAHPAQFFSGHVSPTQEFRSTTGFMQIAFTSVKKGRLA
jgi:hypothetical protein